MLSRYSRAKEYFCYILYVANCQNVYGIKSAYCGCKVGTRTNSFCAHVIAIIWYLSYARHKDPVPIREHELHNIFASVAETHDLPELATVTNEQDVDTDITDDED